MPTPDSAAWILPPRNEVVVVELFLSVVSSPKSRKLSRDGGDTFDLPRPRGDEYIKYSIIVQV